MEQTPRLPASQRIAGGIAALYLAAACLVAMPYFLLVVDYTGARSTAERLALLADHAGSMYAVTLVTYFFFGLALAALASALHERFESTARTAARLVAGIGVLWACLLVASGAVFNLGMENALGLRATDADAAVAAWRPSRRSPTRWVEQAEKSWAAAGCCWSAWRACARSPCRRRWPGADWQSDRSAWRQ
jgi:hypothetical protein